MPILETERLRLRELAPEDAEFILELLNEPAFIRNIADKGVRDLDGAQAYIANGPAASYRRHGFGLWLVELKEPKTSVGICGLIKRDDLDDVDIGFAFLERHWSKGYAVEAAAATLRHGFERLSMKRIVAFTAMENADSMKVLTRIGMRSDGLIELPQYGGTNRLFVIETPGNG